MSYWRRRALSATWTALSERFPAHRPLEQDDVAERVRGRQRAPPRLRLAAVADQQQQRQIRPGRLVAEAARQPLERPRIERLARDDGGAGALRDARAELVDRPADRSRGVARRQHLGDHRGIPAGRRQHEDTVGLVVHGRRATGHGCSSRCALPTKVGWPVRTPLNSRSGSPIERPRGPKRSSRIVRSCAPPRRLNADSAWRTSPACS